MGLMLLFKTIQKCVPTKQGLLLTQNIPNSAHIVINLPHLKISSILEVGPLCDDNIIVIFDKHKVYTIKNTPAV